MQIIQTNELQQHTNNKQYTGKSIHNRLMHTYNEDGNQNKINIKDQFIYYKQGNNRLSSIQNINKQLKLSYEKDYPNDNRFNQRELKDIIQNKQEQGASSNIQSDQEYDINHPMSNKHTRNTTKGLNIMKNQKEGKNQAGGKTKIDNSDCGQKLGRSADVAGKRKRGRPFGSSNKSSLNNNSELVQNNTAQLKKIIEKNKTVGQQNTNKKQNSSDSSLNSQLSNQKQMPINSIASQLVNIVKHQNKIAPAKQQIMAAVKAGSAVSSQMSEQSQEEEQQVAAQNKPVPKKQQQISQENDESDYCTSKSNSEYQKEQQDKSASSLQSYQSPQQNIATRAEKLQTNQQRAIKQQQQPQQQQPQQVPTIIHKFALNKNTQKQQSVNVINIHPTNKIKQILLKDSDSHQSTPRRHKTNQQVNSKQQQANSKQQQAKIKQQQSEDRIKDKCDQKQCKMDDQKGELTLAANNNEQNISLNKKSKQSLKNINKQQENKQITTFPKQIAEYKIPQNQQINKNESLTHEVTKQINKGRGKAKKNSQSSQHMPGTTITNEKIYKKRGRKTNQERAKLQREKQSSQSQQTHNNHITFQTTQISAIREIPRETASIKNIFDSNKLGGKKIGLPKQQQQLNSKTTTNQTACNMLNNTSPCNPTGQIIETDQFLINQKNNKINQKNIIEKFIKKKASKLTFNTKVVFQSLMFFNCNKKDQNNTVNQKNKVIVVASDDEQDEPQLYSKKIKPNKYRQKQKRYRKIIVQEETEQSEDQPHQIIERRVIRKVRRTPRQQFKQNKSDYEDRVVIVKKKPKRLHEKYRHMQMKNGYEYSEDELE